MKILIAEDDLTSRLLLEHTLTKWEYAVVSVENGAQAWEVLQGDDPPRLAILDWMMPEVDGMELCQRIRTDEDLKGLYIIMLTAKVARNDIVSGLESGADDYITKPFNREELHARVNVGLRVVSLQHALTDRVEELQNALDQIKTLKGIIPICSYCKKIRDDHNYWLQVESYIAQNSEAEFSHGVCPDCYAKHVQPQLDEIKSSTHDLKLDEPEHDSCSEHDHNDEK